MTTEEFQDGVDGILNGTPPKGVDGSLGITKALLSSIASFFAGILGEFEAVAATIASKAPIDSPTFTGTVAGITKSMVGLGNVNNTADADKPVSTAQQAALNNKLSSVTVATYAAMLALGAVSVTTVVKVAADEDKGINNSIYFLYPDGVRMWLASTVDS